LAAKHLPYSRSHDAVVRVYNAAGDVMETLATSLNRDASRADGCRVIVDPAPISSTIPARFTAHGAV